MTPCGHSRRSAWAWSSWSWSAPAAARPAAGPARLAAGPVRRHAACPPTCAAPQRSLLGAGALAAVVSVPLWVPARSPTEVLDGRPVAAVGGQPAAAGVRASCSSTALGPRPAEPAATPRPAAGGAWLATHWPSSWRCRRSWSSAAASTRSGRRAVGRRRSCPAHRDRAVLRPLRPARGSGNSPGTPQDRPSVTEGRP